MSGSAGAHVCRFIITMMTLLAARAHGASAANMSIHVPINVPMASVRAELESAIPAKIERLGATEFDGGWGFRYGAWRGPIVVSAQGNALRIGTRIQFAVWICRKVPRPWGGSFCQPAASCGYGNDPLAAVDVTATVAAQWATSWSITPSVTMASTIVHPCRLTVLNIDATGRAIGMLRAKLEAEAARFKERLTLRAAADQAWRRITALPLGHDQWLTWEAEAVRVEPIVFQPQAIVSGAVLDIRISAVTSATPPPSGGLPAALTLAAPPARPANWKLKLAVPWSDITSLLSARLGVYRPADDLEIRLSRVSAAASRVQLEFAVSGAIVATITASGALGYDASTGEIVTSELRLDALDPLLASRVDTTAFTATLDGQLSWSYTAVAGPMLSRIDQQMDARGIAHPPLAGARPDTLTITPSQLEAELTMAGLVMNVP